MSSSAGPLTTAQHRMTLPINWLRVSGWIDTWVVMVMLAVASVIRLPYLWDIPRFTDESNEALKGLIIAHRRIAPLTNIDPYIGPLWNYLLALAFSLTGPSVYTPRTLVGVFGVLTVAVTYVFGRAIGGRLVGAVAAAFLALAPAHIVVNSHIGWSNCITPLLTTLALWLTYRAVSRDIPSGLAWAGLTWGLALQTHPTVVLFFPAVALYVALAHPRWLKTVWPWAAAALALAACSPLVIANIRSGFGGLDAGLRVQEEYARGEALSLGVYARRLGDALALLSDSLSGTLAEFEPLRGPITAPLGLIFLVLALAGLAQAPWRGGLLLAITFATFILLLPIVNARFEPAVPKARYITPLLPLCYTAIGLAVAGLSRRAAQLAPRAIGLAIAVRAGTIAVVAALLIGPLLSLQAYYQDDIAHGRTNANLYATIARVNAARKPGDHILVDRSLLLAYTPGGGRLYEHLQFASSVYDWNRHPVDLSQDMNDPLLSAPGVLVVADRNVGLALTLLRLDAVDDGGPSEHTPAQVFRVLGPRTP